MIGIQEFIRLGGAASDEELYAMIQKRMLAAPVAQQHEWLQQLELSLDGYGGERQLAAAGRVRQVVKRLREAPAPTP